MIVVTTCTDGGIVENFTSACQGVDIPDFITLLCNGDDAYFDAMHSRYSDIYDVRRGYDKYDFGSVLQSLSELDADKFLFIHDSCSPKSVNCFERMLDVSDGSVNAWASFIPQFDNAEQEQWCEGVAGSLSYDLGVFGPIFAITRNTLESIDEVHDIDVDSKMKQQAMERVWPILFRKHGISVNFFETFKHIQKGTTKLFDKTFYHRGA